jgi:hypothetical protein
MSGCILRAFQIFLISCVCGRALPSAEREVTMARNRKNVEPSSKDDQNSRASRREFLRYSLGMGGAAMLLSAASRKILADSLSLRPDEMEAAHLARQTPAPISAAGVDLSDASHSQSCQDCTGSCVGGCLGGCTGSCLGNCFGSCVGLCQGGCLGSCLGLCLGSCLGMNV